MTTIPGSGFFQTLPGAAGTPQHGQPAAQQARQDPSRTSLHAAAAPTEPSGEFVLPEQGVNLDELEQDLIRQAMERTKGVKAHAATLLGLTRDQIRTRLKKIEE